jgi:multidrug efflux pump subunit AcrA (membrane-fusion protein)
MKSRKWIVSLISILVIAAGAYWIFYSRNASANISDKDLITAQRVDFPLIVSASGVLEATRSVSITPPQVKR